jgi:hypothetical protein
MSMGQENPGLDNSIAARNMTNLPGILLIAVGVFNLLLAMYLVVNLVRLVNMPIEEVEKAMETMRKRVPQLEPYFSSDEAPTPEELKKGMLRNFTVWSIVSILAALLILVGGIRLRQLRSYGLALTGSLVSIVPCVSCTACCGLGEIVGLWAFIVLCNEEVRTAFR